MRRSARDAHVLGDALRTDPRCLWVKVTRNGHLVAVLGQKSIRHALERVIWNSSHEGSKIVGLSGPYHGVLSADPPDNLIGQIVSVAIA